MYKKKHKISDDSQAVQRNSSIELFRIITMVFIVAHHYIVNSGVLQEILSENTLNFNSIFALLFGWGGKTGINCFVLITGYFMCKSNISLRKFLKLFLEIEFYNIVINLIFFLCGYKEFFAGEVVKILIPIGSIGTGFTQSYLIFFLFIPYLNLLIHEMDEKKHFRLILLCLTIGTIIQTFLWATPAFTYVGWFMVLYFIASYIRLYPHSFFKGAKKWCCLTIVSLLLSWGSVISGAFIYHYTGKDFIYYFISDSNKILALT